MQKPSSAGHDKIVGLCRARLKFFDTVLNSLLKSAEIFFFVEEGIKRSSPARFDFFGELDALVDRLLAGDLIDEIAHDAFDILRGFAGRIRDFGQNFAEVRRHDVLPAFAHEA